MAIAKKLGADITNGRAHQNAIVTIGDTIVATFGIRHDRRSGHGHIPKRLHVNLRTALGLARCPISRANYERILRDQGQLAVDSDAPN